VSSASKSKLGRGLDALLPTDEPAAVENEQTMLPPDQIEANPFQPRSDFDEASLASLTESIRTHGVLQPVLVRRIAGSYQLVAGERRWRAAIQAGITEIPVRVLAVDDAQMFEMAIIENVQREDLNPIEKAHAFKAYMDNYDVGPRQLADRLSLDRTTVTNFVRLLELPEEIQVAMRQGLLGMGHGRALLAVGTPERQSLLCKKAVSQGLSVREVETLAASDKGHRGRSKGREKSTKATAHIRSLEQDLTRSVGTRVQIREGRKKGDGTILINFYGHAEFERILEFLGQKAQ